jgi:ribonuclease R
LESQVAVGKLRRIGKTRYQWVRELERAPAREAKSRAQGRGRGATRQHTQRVEGRYSRVRAGFGFVEVLGPAAHRFPRDILIPEGMEGAALHGDRVLVEVVRRDPRLRRVVGRVSAVTDSVHERIIGTIRESRSGWLLMPENELLPPVQVIGGTLPKREQIGLVALLRVTRPAKELQGPAGEIEKVLGSVDDPEVQFLVIAYEHGLRVEFPAGVLAEADALPADPDEADFAGREDLRALPFVTIDGETARDFDDAVCIEALTGGRTRLWVAIADVSHYVRPGSALDAEADHRGTSVYFPDRAIPMLPPQLSNQLCSLNPQRARLVLVAELTHDRSGNRGACRFYRAVMTSRARLTYEKVALVLSGVDTPEVRSLRTELGPLVESLELMRDLMRKLQRNRMQAGSLDLDLPEALIDLSEEGRSVGVRLLDRNDAHRLIEEMMLEANCAVARYLSELEIPLPYRVHEPPDPADIDELNEFLLPFGFHVAYEGQVEPGDVQRALDGIQKHRLSRVLSRRLLRSLTKAQYSTSNAGHFGLAFSSYCHFTSPIRRYPDLLVHRQLGRVFDGERELARAQGETLEAASIRSSQAERDAMEAERAMVDLKKAEFMLEHLREPHPGTIVSIASFGFFVELDAYPVEGLVRTDDLPGDHYRFIEREQALQGTRTRQRFRLGDRVLVETMNVSLRRRQIDLALLQRLTAARPEREAERGAAKRNRKGATPKSRKPKQGTKRRKAT